MGILVFMSALGPKPRSSCMHHSSRRGLLVPEPRRTSLNTSRVPSNDIRSAGALGPLWLRYQHYGCATQERELKEERWTPGLTRSRQADKIGWRVPLARTGRPASQPPHSH